MQVLHERFADDPSVAILAVHFDDRGDPAGSLEEHGYTFRAIPQGKDVSERFGVTMLPTFVVVGPDGGIIHKHTGQMTDTVRDEIERVALEARVEPG